MPIVSRLTHRWNANTPYAGSPLADEVASADLVADFTPVYRGYEGTPYVHFPPAVAEHLLAPAVGIATTGFLDLRIRTRNNWSGTTRMLWGPRHGIDTANGFWLEWDNSPARTLRFGWSPDGTDAAFLSANATAEIGISGTSDQTLRVLLTFADAANGGNYTLKFFRRADDGDAWTQNGTTINGGAPTSVFAGAKSSRISGFVSDVFPLINNRIYYIKVLDSTGEVFNLDMGRAGALQTEAGQPLKIIEEHAGYEYSLISSDTITADGSVVFVDAPSFQFNSGRFDGGDVADYPDGGPMLVYAIVRLLRGQTDQQIAICKAASSASTQGWCLFVDENEQPAFRVTGSVSVLTVSSTPLLIGQKVIIIGYRNAGAQVLRVHETEVASSATSIGTTAGNATDLSIGAGNGATVDEARQLQVLECGIMFDVASTKDLANLPYELGLSPVPAIPDVGRSSTNLGIHIGL